MRVFVAQNIARELDDRALHTKTNAEIGNLILARVAYSQELAFDTALAETAGDKNSLRVLE